MSGPRLSIIPAGAVFDRTLEGRDLQVLALLGIHTNKLGWCFKSQVRMAHELGCGRSSIQRSLDRLYSSDWVEKRLRTKGRTAANPERPHAAHAYRVKLDRTDIRFDELDDGEEFDVVPDDAEWCPPVGTGCPPRAGTGCPRMHGHMNVDSNESDDSARARAAGYSSEAEQIAAEIAEIAGVDSAKQKQWFIAGPAVIVQRWLDSGYQRWHLIEGAKQVMLGRTSAPDDIRYFGKRWQRVRGESEAPAPVPTNGDNHETIRRAGKSRSPITAAIDGLIERIDGSHQSGGATSEAAPRLLPHRRSE